MFSGSTIFSLTHEAEEVWPDETLPMLSAESGCVSMPKFKSCSSILFSGEYTIFWFL